MIADDYVSDCCTAKMSGRLVVVLVVAILVVNVDCVKVVDGLDYIGCFQSTNPSFPTQVTPSGGVTPSTCTAECHGSGYRYAGLKNANECWCTNDLTSTQTGRFTIADEYHYRAHSTSYNRCTTGCSDDGNHRCGDGSHFSVYASQANLCLSNPCRSGATCIDLIDDYECACPTGLYGKNCELGLVRSVYSNQTYDQCINTCSKEGQCTNARHTNGNCIVVSRTGGNNGEVYGACWAPKPLGLGDDLRTIPDDKMTASSAPGGHETWRARLYADWDSGADGWRSGSSTPNVEWFQVELPSVHQITSLAMQGRYDNSERITTFKIQYSVDGTNYVWYNNEQVFTGNDIDHIDSVRYQYFDPPFDALKVRMWMVSCNSIAALRMEIYGCPKTWTADPPAV